MNEKRLRRRIFFFILFFIFATLISGITAFPLDWELSLIKGHIEFFPSFMHEWMLSVYNGVHYISLHYPFLGYGTDWLAFAHIVISIAFVGPLRDPIKNQWIIDWAMISCLLVIPLALIAGPLRGIPFYHQLIDCSFGIIGLIPLMIVKRDIKYLEKIIS